jgi:selenide,water dikinase
MDKQIIRLSSLSHGGGCGCKIAPALLNEMLSKLPSQFAAPALLVGTETGDDAAVYKINDRQALVATTDFFMPIVDDAFDFGRIAATNALSDVYAIGGQPLFALAIVGVPVDKLPVETVQDILAGGAAACEAAGIPIAGGHSIDAPEPIYGLVAVGLVDPDNVKRNNEAKAGDVLILGKGLGIGILSAAMKKNELNSEGYKDLGKIGGVHAMTDVTGFGLLGHLLEVCRGSKLTASLHMERIPILPTARELAMAGLNTGAADRNWASYGHQVTLPEGVPDWQKNLLVDPQTNGGLLVSCDPTDADQVLGLFRDQGFTLAGEIGVLQEGAVGIVVQAAG